MASILAIDDMRSMRELVKSVLEKRGHSVSICEDGTDALRFAENQQVDLVISDINMPQLNGIELVAALRQLPGYAATPILMLTTEDTTEKKQQARGAGANGWIQKPFTPDRLAAAVDKTLAKA